MGVICVLGVLAGRDAAAAASGTLLSISSSGRVRGWARDPGNGATPNPAPISVDLYVDSLPKAPDYPGFIGTAKADQPSVEINLKYPTDPGNHAFSYMVPTQYFDGNWHTLRGYALGRDGSNPQLVGSPMQFQLPKNPIIGSISVPYVDIAGNVIINGWACQVGVAATIPVSVYAGGSAYFSDGSPLSGTPVASSFTSSTSPSDVVTACHPATPFSTFNFRITVPVAERLRYQGLPLFVHGLRVTGTSQNAALTGSGTYQFLLDPNMSNHLVSGIPRVYVTPAQLATLLSDPRFTTGAVWQEILNRANAAPATATPYFGTDHSQFEYAAGRELGAVPYLAIACRIAPGGTGSDYCAKGIALLKGWATAEAPATAIDPECASTPPSPLHAGIQLYCPKSVRPDDDPSVQAGLTLSRYMGQIAEAYQLLARNMTVSERIAIVSWIRELGYTVKKSQFAWNEKAFEGAGNHMQWHNYGMALAGLVAGDNDLVTFALTDPANVQTDNSGSTERNFFRMVTDAIFEDGNDANQFYGDPYDSPASKPLTGEIFDRYRDYSDHKGFPYSLFALSPMAYTAHLAQINGITNDRDALMNLVDTRYPSAGPSIPNAMRCYAKMINDAASLPITYAPYAGESGCSGRGDVGSLIIGKSYPQLQGTADQASLTQAFNLCRDQRSLVSGTYYFESDTATLFGISQLYLMLVNNAYFGQLWDPYAPNSYSDLNVGIANGTATHAGTQSTLTARGNDIYNTSDQFIYANQVLPAGDGWATVKVTDLTNTDAFTKAGIMIRNGTGADAPNVMIAITPGSGAIFQYRQTKGGATTANIASNPRFPIWLRLVKTGSTFSGWVSYDLAGWNQIGPAIAIPNLALNDLVGLATTSHNPNMSATGSFDYFTWAPSNKTTLFDANIGITDGSRKQDFRSDTIWAGGTDIYGASDQFFYAYKMLNGNGTITAYITAIANTDPYAKAGLMFRSSAAANSPNAMIEITPAHGAGFQYRASASGSTTSTFAAPNATPKWLKLERSADTFTGSVSDDGTTWTRIGSPITIAGFGANAMVGLAVTSHNPAAQAKAIFTNVSLP
jgi:hypothetical protein